MNSRTSQPLAKTVGAIVQVTLCTVGVPLRELNDDESGISLGSLSDHHNIAKLGIPLRPLPPIWSLSL
jgi:hypothetical protein